jgi:hypothetical protein
VSHERKEAIKVGYNLRRKVILLVIWALSPLALLLDPTLFGAFEAHADLPTFVEHTAWIWLAVGLGALALRTMQLCVVQDVRTGVAWLLKIVTDPFHDVLLYHKAPLHLLRGELIDPMQPRRPT